MARMWTAISQEQIDLVADRGGVVTILLAQAMNQELLSWVHKAWLEIDKISGERWHLVVPSTSYDWVKKGRPPLEKDYHWELADSIGNSVGLRSTQDFPCLLLEDYSDYSDPLFISLAGDEVYRTRIINRITEISREMATKNRIRDAEYRSKENRKLRNALRLRLLTDNIPNVIARTLPGLAGKAIATATAGCF